MNGPISRFIVVDLTRQLAGPTVTRILADLGSRVIKVVQSGSKGDVMGAQKEMAAQLWAKKEIVELDLRSNEGIELLHRLLSKADVLVENFKPGVMEKMGLSWNTVHKRHPKLIYSSVSGFGNREC